MNYIPKNWIANEDRQYYTEIRKRFEIEHLKEIFKGLKDHPGIRFKDSMVNRLNGSKAEPSKTPPPKPFVDVGYSGSR